MSQNSITITYIIVRKITRIYIQISYAGVSCESIVKKHLKIMSRPKKSQECINVQMITRIAYHRQKHSENKNIIIKI